MGEEEEGPGLSWPTLLLPCLPLGAPPPVSFSPVMSELGMGLAHPKGHENPRKSLRRWCWASLQRRDWRDEGGGGWSPSVDSLEPQTWLLHP